MQSQTVISHLPAVAYMLESVQHGTDEIANAYLDLANELCKVGLLLKQDDQGSAAPYHIFLIGSQFVVLKRYKPTTNSSDTVEPAGTICIALEQDDALGLAFGRGRAPTLTTRWLVLPVRRDGAWSWHWSAAPTGPVSSRELAADFHRRLRP